MMTFCINWRPSTRIQLLNEPCKWFCLPYLHICIVNLYAGTSNLRRVQGEPLDGGAQVQLVALSMHAPPPMLLLDLLGDATPRMLHPLSVP